METTHKGTSPQAEGDASIEEQAVALKSQWEWILKQSIERKEVVEEVVAQLEQFEAQHAAMSRFMADGQQQLTEEKPIGNTPQKIREQLDSCKVRVCADEAALNLQCIFLHDGCEGALPRCAVMLLLLILEVHVTAGTAFIQSKGY